MPAKKDEPFTRIGITLADSIRDRLDQYPGDRSWKIQYLVEAGLEAGFLMSYEEAKKLAKARAEELLRSAGAKEIRIKT